MTRRTREAGEKGRPDSDQVVRSLFAIKVRAGRGTSTEYEAPSGKIRVGQGGGGINNAELLKFSKKGRINRGWRGS